MTKILNAAFNMLKSQTGFVAENCAGLIIESSSNVFPVIKAGVYAFKRMISNEIETALTDSQDRSACSAEKVGSTGDSHSLAAHFPNYSKMVSSFQNRCLYLS